MNPNQQIYDENWLEWRDMKVYGPASRWLRSLADGCLQALDRDRLHAVLDVGCGEGTTTAMLAQRLPRAQVMGIDFSEGGIALARETYASERLSFLKDTESRTLQERKFDLVTCFEVLEHVDEWQDLLGRICDASAHAVMLSFPTGRMRPYEVHVGHVRNFARGEVESFMAQRGFVPRRIYYAGFPFFSPIYRDLCDRMDVGGNKFSRGRYGASQKIVAAVLLAAFRFFSLRGRGDQFCGVFVREAA